MKSAQLNCQESEVVDTRGGGGEQIFKSFRKYISGKGSAHGFQSSCTKMNLSFDCIVSSTF